MEVRNNVVGVVQLNVNRRNGKNDSGEPPNGEDHNETNSKEHRGLEGHGPTPHGCKPVKDLHARWHCNKHGGVHKEQLAGKWHAGCKHVVRPDHEGEDGNGGCGIDHGAVAKQALARKGGDDLRDDSKGRKNHDVDLRMPEEPEDVLVHDGVTTGRGVEKRRAEVAVGKRHGDGASKYGHHRNKQVGRNKPGPDKHGHLHEGHAGCAHVQDGGDDVNGAHDGRGTQNMKCEDGHVHANTHLKRQGRIECPSCRNGTAWNKKGSCQKKGRRNHQPETEVVHACKGHIGGANLQGDHPVRKTHEGRHDCAKHHNEPMHGGELVEELWLNKLNAWLKELDSNA